MFLSILTAVCYRKSNLSLYHSVYGSVLPPFIYFSVFELSTLSEISFGSFMTPIKHLRNRLAFAWHVFKALSYPIGQRLGECIPSIKNDDCSELAVMMLQDPG